MSLNVNRREFLQAGAVGALGYLYTGPAISVARAQGANERLRVAGIGVGGKGSSDIDQAGELMQVVAVCDIDTQRLSPKAKKWPDAKQFQDFRKLFDDSSLMKNIDAVVVSTPDHTHALPCMMAMRDGKHVYCQKPLTQTVFESRLLREAAAKYKVCTQMGNQGTALPGLRRAVELVQDGIIGPINEVHVWTNRPVWPQAPQLIKRPESKPVPDHVNWDCFLGPAPERPYAPGYHPFNWRGWWDFGTGAIGDMACHTANMAFMALKLAHPNRVSAEAGDVNDETCPSYARVILEFPARGDLPPVKLYWYEGRKDGQKLLPPSDLAAKVLKDGEQFVNSGSIMVGEKGILYSPNDYGAAFRITPGELTEGVNTSKPEKLAEYGGGGNDANQKKEWVEAIKAGKPTVALANFDYAALLTEAFLLGNVAIRSGQPFEWDGETGKASTAEAQKYVHREYRKGWDMLGDKA